MEMQSPETPVSSSPKSIIWIIVSIILAIVLIIFGTYFYTKSKVTTFVETGIQNLELTMSTQDAEMEKLTNKRLLSKLSLSPKIYSNEESVLKKDFENSNLTSLSSGTQSS
jgi:uncharacterized protein YacL